MKKLLTVVLCIAVVFTFSFSGAFASSSYKEALGNEYLNSALEAIDDTTDYDGVWVANNGTVTASASTVGEAYKVSYATLKDNLDLLQNEAKEYYDATETYINKDNAKNDTTAIATLLTANKSEDDLYKTLVEKQYAADKADAIEALSVSLSDVSTDEMSDDCTCTGKVKCKTYKDHVEKLLKNIKSDINGFSTDDDTAIYTSKTGKDEADSYVGYKAYIDSVVWSYSSTSPVNQIVLEKGFESSASEYVGIGTYEFNEEFKDYYEGGKTYETLSSYLKDSKTDSDTNEAAAKASAKARMKLILM